MKEEEVVDCEELIIPAAGGAYGPPSPIISVKNNIYFLGEIDETLSRSLIGSLHELAMENIQVSLDHDVPIPPINLIINSPGGEVSCGIAVVQTIKDIQNGTIHKINGQPIKVEVNTHIQGEADSAASLIASCGNHRTISKYSLSLLHEVRQIGGIGGKAGDVEVTAENLKKFREIEYDIYIENSKLTREQIEKICEDEGYSTPQQLLEWGLVDEII